MYLEVTYLIIKLHRANIDYFL